MENRTTPPSTPSLARRYICKLLANVASVPVYLAMEAILPRALGPAMYGNYSFATNFFQQLFMFLDMGTSTCFYNALSRRQSETGLISFYMRLSLLIAVISLLIAGTMQVPLVGNWLMPDVPLWLAPLAAIWAFLTWWGGVLRSMNDAVGATVQSEMVRTVVSLSAVFLLIGLFLDASDAAIRRRYKETRRVHPMTISEGIPVSEAITKERQILQPLRERAKYVIDTSLLSTAQNRERVSSLFLQKGQCAMSINVVSFGFKYGLPQEADIVFDVRCLPNPFYVPELKEKTGLDQEVVDYVMKFPESQELLRRIESFLEYALPLYVKEGKSQLMIAIGCTGGKHRSITFARKIGEYCTKLGYQPSVQHRDARRTA